MIVRGIAFPANATAIHLSIGTFDLATAGKIVVRNTPEQLDKLAALNDAPVSNTYTQRDASFQNVSISGKQQARPRPSNL